MAERGIDQQEEKKSYGSVFLIGIALLVALSVWAYVDDNYYAPSLEGLSSAFYRLDYSRAKAAYEEEDKKLQADANYQELSQKACGGARRVSAAAKWPRI